MQKIILSIGIPGAGKTTYLKHSATKNSYIYICPDEIRLELRGDIADQSKNSEVWRTTYTRARDAFLQGHSVIVDATFADKRDRLNFLSFLKFIGAKNIVGIYFKIPLGIAKDRNQSRERVVPVDVLNKMQASLDESPPAIKEGFMYLFVVNEKFDIIEESSI